MDLQWADDATAELLLHLDGTLDGRRSWSLVPTGATRCLAGIRCAACAPSSAAADACRSSWSNRSARWIPPISQPGSLGLGWEQRSRQRSTIAPKGVPFFVEEFAVALAAAGRLEQAGGTVELGLGRPSRSPTRSRSRSAARGAPIVSWPPLAGDCRCGRASGSTWSWWSRLAAQTASMKRSRRVSGGGGPPGSIST